MYNEDLGFDDPDASKTAKVVFERALNYLRHGCVPVGVIDGQAPWQKLGALRARWGAHAGGGGGAFGRCGEVALEVLRALGLPGVEAPGEAEATCAVMDSMGIVDGCVTSDGDSLLFGARTVFKTLRLSQNDQRDLFMERVEAADVGKRLMLGDDVEHVAPALTALALLTGGDYDLTGAKNVGGTKALLVVKALAKDEARRTRAEPGGRDRRQRSLPARLDAFLASAPDPTIEALDKCTGCARCKHDGCLKNKVRCHVRGCSECGTDAGCVERDGVECECPFHARADERWLHKVRERANATDGYARSFRDAARGYAAQARDAEEALGDASDVEWVERAENDGDEFDSFRKMRWRRRPDVARLQEIMETYCQWEPRRTREKLLPVLVEWDMKAARRALRRVEDPSTVDPGRRWELLRRRGVEFVVERIAKVSGNNKAPPWRYLLEVNSADPAHWAAWQRAATGDPAAGESAPKGGTAVLPPNFHERGDDLAFLKGLAQRRSVRMSLVRETCPHLVARFDAGGSKAKSAPSTPAKSKSKPTTPRKTPKTVRGTKTRSPDQHDITSFFSQRRPAAPPSAPPTAPLASTPAPRTPASKRKPPSEVGDDSAHDSDSDEILGAGLRPDLGAVRRLEAKKKLSFVVATEEEAQDEGLASPARPKSSAVNVVDLRTPPGSPARTPAPATSREGRPGGAPASPAPRSPLFSPTKKARQATLFECLSPKKAATPSQPETVDLCTPQK